MVGRYPVELCCPLPVRKIIKHKSVPPKIKGGGGVKKRLTSTTPAKFQIIYSSVLCQMKNLADTQAYLRMNLKSEVMEVVKLRVPTR